MPAIQTIVTRTLLATGAAGVVALNLPELHASAKEAPARIPTSELTIYDEPKPKSIPQPKNTDFSSRSPLALLSSSTNPDGTPRPTPTERLATHIGTGRRFIEAHIRVVQRKTEEVLDVYHEKERLVVGTVASLAPKRDSPEQVLPGVTYSLVAAMGASILVRRRNILLRGFAPVTVGLIAAQVFIPETMGNVGRLVWEWEGRVEGLQESQKKAWDSLVAVKEGVEGGLLEGRRKVEGVVGGVVEGVKEVVRRG